MDAEARLDAAVGSVAEEAARLLEALGRPSDPGAGAGTGSVPDDAPTSEDGTGASADGAAGDHHTHTGGDTPSTCTWCPLCRSVGALRSVSPETLGRLADLASAAAAVLGDLADRRPDPASATTPTPGDDGDRAPRTVPITVLDEEEPS